MNREQVIKNRKINYNDFYWKKYKPSLFIKKFFLKLFNQIYKNFSNEFLIKNIFWNNNTFNIIINNIENWKIFELYFKNNEWIKICKWKFCTDNLCCSYHNLPTDKNFLKFLISFQKKWKDFTLDYFLKVLSNDPKVKKEYYQIFWKAKRAPFSIIQDWWNTLHRMRFIIFEWVLRNIDESLKIILNEAHIQHSERECLWIWPEISLEKDYKFFNFPKDFYDHTYNKYFYLSEKEKKEINNYSSVFSEFTDLNEDDIVMWKWNQKLNESINNILEIIENHNIDIINFNCCCVPRIIWDDINSILKITKKKIDIPFIFSWQLEKTPFEQKVLLLESYLNKIDNCSIKKINKSISLFWYHENKYLDILNNILYKNWIKLNSIFIPTINIKLLENLYKSELFVFSQNKFQEEIFEYPFKNMEINYISPDFPYWINKTINWIKSILWYFNMDYKLSKYEKGIIDNYNEKISYIKKKKYKIGIVFIWKSELNKFFNQDYMNNIDIIWFLEEMWFWIDFFIYDNFKDYLLVNNERKYLEDDWNHLLIKSIINNKIINKNNININFFNNEKEMYKKLKLSNINILYSDIYFDERIIKLWLNQFSTRQFYIWFNWSLDTINEMIKLCEMNYFKNFWKYL